MRFLRRKAIKHYYGLDVGNGAIKLVELSHDLQSGASTLERYLIKPTPLNSVANGIIKDKKKLQQAVSDLRQEFGVRSLTVSTVLTGQNLIVRLVEVPEMPADEFKKVLEIQADSYFGIPADELAADFHIVRTLPANRMLVFLVGSLKQPILDFVDLLADGGIRADRVDIEPLAALRSLRMSGALTKDVANEMTVVLDLGAGTSNLSIFQGNELQMVRVLGVAGNDFTSAIADAQNICWDEAEELKLAHGVRPDSPILATVRPTLERLLQQVSISLEYYQVENRAKIIQKIRVIGGSSQLLGLIDELDGEVRRLFARLDIEAPGVSQGNPCAHLTIAETAAGACESGPNLAVAIGLALGGVAADATD